MSIYLGDILKRVALLVTGSFTIGNQLNQKNQSASSKSNVPLESKSINTHRPAESRYENSAKVKPNPAPDSIALPTPVHKDENIIPSAIEAGVLELIEISVALRKDGDAGEALKKLREAETIAPENPRIIWEMYATYEAMTLHQKAKNEIDKLIRIGPEIGGEYYKIARLALVPTDKNSTTTGASNFLFGQVHSYPSNFKEDGEHVHVKMAILSRLDQPVNPTDITLIVEFYDSVDGSKIEQTRSNQPTAIWTTKPIDWSTTNTEIVEWEYHMPKFSEHEINDFGKRTYHGFVARLYYKDLLQDIFAEPRTLLTPKRSDTNSIIDSSLFPNSN